MENFDVIIIGAGAAGLMCASKSSQRGRKTLIIEHSKKIGEKIRISGGGRCNFTNLNITKDNFISSNSNFCISALKRFNQNDFISLVEKHKIDYHEKTLGQLFCDGKSQQIIDLLLNECGDKDFDIKTETVVNKVERIEYGFVVKTNNGDFQCESLVIASGGLSIPKMGASNFGYRIAKQFGLDIITPEAALVPFTLHADYLEKTKALSGVSANAIVSVGKRKFRENILFTHKGLSGPAILQISSYTEIGQEVRINLLPEIDVFDLLKTQKNENPKQEIGNILNAKLAKSLVNFILENESRKLAETSDKKLREIANNINEWRIIPNGTEGFAKAEVTIGGVDTNEISSKTFESGKVKNLYFIGEVLDVTGHLGGYNFQWAWSSGYCSGQYV